MTSQARGDCRCDHHSPAAAGSGCADSAASGLRFHIAELCCPSEERLLRAVLEPMPEVRALSFNLLERVLTVDAESAAAGALQSAITGLGFTPRLLVSERPVQDALDGAADSAMMVSAFARLPWRLLAAGLCALVAELVDWQQLAGEVVVAALSLGAVALGGMHTYRKGWIALRHADFNIYALMSLAVTGALLIRQWPEAAMVMVLFSLAEKLEAASMERARHAIRGLMALAPDIAWVRDGGGDWRSVVAEKVEVGEVVRVRPGEKIPLDGLIRSGCAAVNEAPVTGESLPVDKQPGDAVYAGSLNESGLLEVTVTARASDSTLARVIHAVEKAQSERAPTQRFIDRFARRYTPLVLILALLTMLGTPWLLDWAWQDSVYRALVLLVIACPCALVISAPVTLVSGLTSAARHGLLIKGGRYLEQGSQLRALALDKTGTLTAGTPTLVSFVPLAEADRQLALLVSEVLASHSSHPLSRALLNYVSGLSGRATPGSEVPVQAYRALAGRGLQGLIDGQRYWLGSPRLIRERGIALDAVARHLESVKRRGESPLLLANQERILALFAFADRPKAQGARALEQLRGLGVHTMIVSGDTPASVAAVARQLGVEVAHGHLLPEQKLKLLRDAAARYGAIGMVGDGINDAPALAGAQIGFAMAAAGSDVALESADVAIMDDNLEKIPWFIAHSRRTLRVLRQNIVLALGIKGVFLLLALLGQATLWMAVFADLGASLLVIFNGLRLLDARGVAVAADRSTARSP